MGILYVRTRHFFMKGIAYLCFSTLVGSSSWCVDGTIFSLSFSFVFFLFGTFIV